MIKLKIKDEREFFGNFRQKKPYYLFIQYGEKSFVFSNKKKAERWLSKFQKESTELYKELARNLSLLYSLNIDLVDFLDYSQAQKRRMSLEWFTKRYYDVMCGMTMGDISIGREINVLYLEIESQLSFYKNSLRSNNRYRSKYEDVRFCIKNLKRLGNEFDILLRGADGIKYISDDSIKQNQSEMMLYIA